MDSLVGVWFGGWIGRWMDGHKWMDARSITAGNGQMHNYNGLSRLSFICPPICLHILEQLLVLLHSVSSLLRQRSHQTILTAFIYCRASALRAEACVNEREKQSIATEN